LVPGIVLAPLTSRLAAQLTLIACTIHHLSTLRSFFFSSSRRHTRSKRDWSSDVCSSDLYCVPARAAGLFGIGKTQTGNGLVPPQIGRASCRERGEKSGIAVLFNKE